ncbi:hypothetical protein O181_005993 [Austropuccinia psidii MF-1]|uniref:Reverse transcriptase RNase H-like domain-containing protein n=1 Tax=Austropuccinia psidii MF-1 TaxID=1389203 RepID=A0A9Q3BJB9_9BASI|nr:hypothetical protein [Austropuccinia psidii MF-1]
MIENEVENILHVENSYPPLLRRLAYSGSPRAREALEVYIKGLMDLGVLRKARHNKQLEVSDPGKHPISFKSRKRIPEELNYEIHDKDLLGIVWALKRWSAFVLSLSSPFEALTDHSSLQYFMSSKVLTRRQACWAEFFS